MKTTVENVSPITATEMLSRNGHNRPIRWSHVSKLATEMSAGRWQQTHQGIAFDIHGNLIDGQHRLYAIIESGITVSMAVSRQCAPASFRVLDRGSTRSVSDITGINQKSVAVLSLAIKLLTSKYASTPHLIVDLSNTELGKACNLIMKNFPTKRPKTTSAPVMLAASLNLAEGEGIGFVYGQLDALISQSYDKMTKCTQSFNRQILSENLDKQTLFSKAVCVFDSSKQETIKIITTPDSHTKANNRLRIFVSPVLKS